MAHISKTQDVVIGAFYQRSADPMDVVRSNAGDTNHLYGFDAHRNAFTATNEEVKKWTQLAVNDFPNSPEPRLPYVFDLHWDLKYIDQLEWTPVREQKEVAALLVEHFGVENPFDNIEALTQAVRKHNDLKNGYTVAPVPISTPSPGH